MITSVRGCGLYRTCGYSDNCPERNKFHLFANQLIAKNYQVADDLDKPTAIPLQFSTNFENDGIMFAMAFQDIIVSYDRGSNWQLTPFQSNLAGVPFQPSRANLSLSLTTTQCKKSNSKPITTILPALASTGLPEFSTRGYKIYIPVQYLAIVALVVFIGWTCRFFRRSSVVKLKCCV